MPPVDMEGAAQLVGWFQSCGPAKSGAMGMVPIDWQDIAAWAQVTAWPIEPQDAEDMHAMSQAYVSALNRHDEKPDPAPYVAENRDPAPVADIRAAFRARGLKGKTA